MVNIKSICPNCNKEFDVIAAQKYCSIECREEARKSRNSAERQVKLCPNCNKDFTPITRSDQKFCSVECREEAKAKRVKKPPLTERTCKFCGEIFKPTVGKQIYCSVEHSFRGNYAENADSKKKNAREYRVNNLEKVRKQDRESKKKHKAKKAKADKAYRDKIYFSGNKAIALERDGYKCTRCGATDNLAMHHKDGSGQTDNPNNDLDNLETLCDSCHTLHHNPRFDTTPHAMKTCLNCGIEFRVSDARTEDGRGKFHSKECQFAYKTKMNTVTLNCEYCGIEFTVPLSRFKRGKVKYHNAECRKAAGYAWTKYSRTEYNQRQALK